MTPFDIHEQRVEIEKTWLNIDENDEVGQKGGRRMKMVKVVEHCFSESIGMEKMKKPHNQNHHFKIKTGKSFDGKRKAEKKCRSTAIGNLVFELKKGWSGWFSCHCFTNRLTMNRILDTYISLPLFMIRAVLAFLYSKSSLNWIRVQEFEMHTAVQKCTFRITFYFCCSDLNKLNYFLLNAL